MYYCLKRRSMKSQKGRKPVPPATITIFPLLIPDKDNPIPLELLNNKLLASLYNKGLVIFPSLYFFTISGMQTSC